MTTKFICEIGSNHNRDLARTMQLIEKAKDIGAWAVKFQLFKAELLYHKSFTTQIEKMKKWELPLTFIPDIRRKCDELGLKFICTPFHLEAVKFLENYVDFFKIGSYENQWPPLIKAVANTNKPWMLSNGMEDNGGDVVEKLYNLGVQNKAPFVLFHCNSSYPALAKNCNLDQISDNLMLMTGIHWGWSDHTVEPGVIYNAIALGAEYIEFHFDLEDGKGFEASVGHCWKPSKITEVIYNVRVGELAEQNNDTGESEAKKWRTDPVDGLRPLIKYRKELL